MVVIEECMIIDDVLMVVGDGASYDSEGGW